MSVEMSAGKVVLRGRCGVEEAENLLSLLLSHPEAAVVLEAETIHTALWQVLLAVRPSVEGKPLQAFCAHHVMPLIVGTGDREQGFGRTTTGVRSICISERRRAGNVTGRTK